MTTPRSNAIYALISDNTSRIAPEIMDAVVKANEGDLPSYGFDYLTQAVEERLSDIFETKAWPFFASTGTAANSLALATLCPPYKRVLCQRYAHIMETEAGAPEAFGGGLKLTSPDNRSPKLTVRDLETSCAPINKADAHAAYYGAVSFSQATEAGTVYQAAELKTLASTARSLGLRVHVDGARIANALVSIGATAPDFGPRAGVDAISFGISKNGGAFGDAAVVFDEAMAEELRFRHMRSGHLIAKGRYVAAQALAALTNDLWLRLAAQANAAASRIGEGLEAKGYELAAPVEANLVFAMMPQAVVEATRAAGYDLKLRPASRFGLDESHVGDRRIVRIVASWDTEDATIRGLLDAL